MKEPDHFGETLPEGVQLTLSELRDMAYRQQAQIDSQHQMLAAKEQRLRYLKEQEARQQRVQAESERLRRLRDRVDAQELKLRKLRVLRGQVDHQKQNNISLTSDLDSIRALFNEKEKELSLAVAKVEELTRQLEELRRGRNDRDQPPASALELDKLRRELLYRNKLNEQQNQRLNQQREALTARQEEMSAIDKRISELQERLHKKRLLNQQLANQISAASHKAAYHQLVRLTSGNRDQNFNRNHHHPPPSNNHHGGGGLPRVNIAAVEPYNHIPARKLPQVVGGGGLNNNNKEPASNSPQSYLVYHKNGGGGVAKENEEPLNNNEEPHQDFNKMMKYYGAKGDDNDILKEFNVSKLDPKYQTLPYNTKFTINLLPNKILNNNKVEGGEGGHHQDVAHMTVHSSPLLIVSKNVATPLTPANLLLPSESANIFNYQKPVSSVAPTSVGFSNIYQTSSIKIQPVEPQTVTSTNKEDSSLILSPPQSSSTPLNVSEVSLDKSKPALPPKPAIKPPPRQTVSEQDVSQVPPPLPLTEPPTEEPPKPVLAVQPTPEPETLNNNNPPDLVLDSDEVDKAEDKAANHVRVKFRKGNLKQTGKSNLSRRVSFDPLALLLDASLEGELELVRKTTTQVANPSAANDEGITALHNAICAGHFEIVKYLVEFGCDVNAQDSDGWTPLHCAASCNNVSMVKFLVEHGACIFATTLSDHETAAEKCEEDEEGFDGCSEYLYSVQEKLGILANGIVYAVFDYTSQQPDELSFRAGEQLTVLRKGDENEREWWWSQLGDKQGYVPRNLLGLYPRVSRTEE